MLQKSEKNIDKVLQTYKFIMVNFILDMRKVIYGTTKAGNKTESSVWIYK